MVHDWLSAYFELAEGEVEFRAFPDKRNGGAAPSIYSRNMEEVEQFVAEWDRPGYGVYFGACTRKPGTSPPGGIAETWRMPAFWVDIDRAPKEQAVAALKGCRLPPSAIVDSGRGTHAYWFLNRPVDVSAATSNDHEAVATLKHLARLFDGDKAVADLARVMRLPGTRNSKHGDRRPVRVLHMTEARS